MDRAERAALRAALRAWRPRQHVEVLVYKLRELLDDCDRLELYDPGAHHRIALSHWQHGSAVEGCRCASCEGSRAQARIAEVTHPVCAHCGALFALYEDGAMRCYQCEREGRA